MAAIKVTVVPETGKGRGWVVDIGDPVPPVGTYRTQREAIEKARLQLEALGGGELEVRGRNGRIREARTFGVKENRRSPV
jgi:hypothetical protein